MKKILSMMIFVVLVLVGCSKTNTNVYEYTLPNLDNMTKLQVEEQFEGAPVTTVFKYKISEEVTVDTFIEYGNDLNSNDKVSYGEVVYIYFSLGTEPIEQVILPDLTGKSINEIVILMNNYQVTVEYNLVDSTVSDQLFLGYGDELVAGTSVDVNSHIVINISKQFYNLPDLSGNTLSEIKMIMNGYDLAVEYKVANSETVASDLFVSYENFASGDKVYVDSKVVINISKFVVAGHVELPDLSGLSKNEISSKFVGLDLTVQFVEEANNLINKDYFIRYQDYNVGEYAPISSTVYVVISNSINYFSMLDLTYDGPRLDSKYTDINPVNPRGGYYTTTLYKCIDGDTAKFDYPSYIDEIVGEYESIRFLNMDTEESTKLKEEWGKPASNFTCGMLTNAESIIIQTDPGDGLTDTYGRLLGWIWIVPDGTEKKPGEITYSIDQYELLNYKIMQQGLAQVKFLFGSGDITYANKSYTDWMYQAENYAKENDLGKWGDLLDPYWDYVNNQPKGW